MDEYMKPINKDGDTVLEVECGKNKAMMYVSKLCQGSKGPCILFQEEWLTPNEFQFVSGRQTAKDWKRSIRHHGKSLKLLLNKGLVSVHPPICDCTGCRQASPKVKNRSSHKKRAPLTAITLCEEAQHEGHDDVGKDEPDMKPVESPAEPGAGDGQTHRSNEDSENKEDEPLPTETPKQVKPGNAASSDEISSIKKANKNSSAKEELQKQTVKSTLKSEPSSPAPAVCESDNSTADDASKACKPPVAVVAPTLAVTSSAKETKTASSPSVVRKDKHSKAEKEKRSLSPNLPHSHHHHHHHEKETTNTRKEPVKPEREYTSSSSSSSSAVPSTPSSNSKTEKTNKKSPQNSESPSRNAATSESETTEKTSLSSSSSSLFRAPSLHERVPVTPSSHETTPKSGGRKSPHYVHPIGGSSIASSGNPHPSDMMHAGRPETTLPLAMEARTPRDPRDEAVISSLSSDYYRLNGFPSPRHLEPNYLSLLHQYSAAHGNYCKWSPTYDVQMSMMPYPVHPSEDARMYSHYLPTSPMMYDAMYMNPRLCCHPPRPEIAPYPYEHLTHTPRKLNPSHERDLRERSPSPRRSIKRKACEASAFSCYSPITPHPAPTLHSVVGLDLSVKRPKLDLHRVY